MLVFISGEFQTNLAGFVEAIRDKHGSADLSSRNVVSFHPERIQPRSRIQFATEFAKTFAMPFGHKASR